MLHLKVLDWMVVSFHVKNNVFFEGRCQKWMREGC